MAQRAQVLADLVVHLRSSVGASVALHVLASTGDGLTIQIGDQTEAVVGVAVRDEQIPSFSISYPKLSSKRSGDQHISIVRSEGVLAAGVAWVVGELAKHGVVKPEFSD